MPLLECFFKVWLLSALFMSVIYLVYLKHKEAAIVDITWGLGIGGMNIFLFFQTPELNFGVSMEKFLLLAATSLWSFKISYLLIGRFLKKQEDLRYRELDKKWGRGQYFLFFQFQALSIPLFLLPHQELYLSEKNGSTAFTFLFFFTYFIGWVGGGIADWQMARFREDSSKNKGKVCQRGLWRYSRHPNYFFEILLWTSYALLASPYATSSYSLALVWLSPLLMLLTIVYVTGIPPTEAILLQSKKEAYQSYQQSTSALIPWFRKKRG